MEDTGLHRGSKRKESKGFGLRDVYPNREEYAVRHSNVKHAIKKTLSKAKSESMVGKLKRLVNEPKRDLYAEFKKQHGMK